MLSRVHAPCCRVSMPHAASCAPDCTDDCAESAECGALVSRGANVRSGLGFLSMVGSVHATPRARKIQEKRENLPPGEPNTVLWSVEPAEPALQLYGYLSIFAHEPNAHIRPSSQFSVLARFVADRRRGSVPASRVTTSPSRANLEPYSRSRVGAYTRRRRVAKSRPRTEFTCAQVITVHPPPRGPWHRHHRIHRARCRDETCARRLSQAEKVRRTTRPACAVGPGPHCRTRQRSSPRHARAAGRPQVRVLERDGRSAPLLEALGRVPRASMPDKQNAEQGRGRSDEGHDKSRSTQAVLGLMRSTQAVLGAGWRVCRVHLGHEFVRLSRRRRRGLP
jgi:hypothetical protein